MKRNDKFVQVVAWLLFFCALVGIPVIAIGFILTFDKYYPDNVFWLSVVVSLIIFGKVLKFIIDKTSKKSMRLNKYYTCRISEKKLKDGTRKPLVILYNKPLFYFFKCEPKKYFEFRDDAMNKVRELYPDALISTTTFTLQKQIEKEKIYLEANEAPTTFFSLLEAYSLTLRNFDSFEKKKFEGFE
ncbi:hypothetical protein [Bacillus sp. Brlt_9]|uniref:hypothetical protein n=1 Tax=Bacillus sp. Brlt_9 TaxID=3110916 RepID=UPI003F7B8730